MKLPGGDYSVYAAYRGNKQEIFAPDGKLDFSSLSFDRDMFY